VFIRFRTIGFDIALVFFGLHCVVLGYLLSKSTFFPRILRSAGGWRGSGYLANIFANVAPLAIGVHLFHIMLPAGAAEILLTLWLIIVGVNASK